MLSPNPPGEYPNLCAAASVKRERKDVYGEDHVLDELVSIDGYCDRD